MGNVARHRASKPRGSTADGMRKLYRQCVVLTLVGAWLAMVGSPLVTFDGEQAPTTSVVHVPKALSFSTPPPSVLPVATYGPFPVAEPSESAKPVQIRSSMPTRLEVPRIDFHARVEGSWLGSPINPPFDPATVAETVYFDTSRGTRPGSSTSRSSYFAGHTCRKDGCLAAFDVLDQNLQVGDDVYVTTKASEVQNLRLHYVVTYSHLYSQRSLPSATEVWTKVPDRLVFITCNLREDGAEQTDNHVLFAEYVGLE